MKSEFAFSYIMSKKFNKYNIYFGQKILLISSNKYIPDNFLNTTNSVHIRDYRL